MPLRVAAIADVHYAEGDLASCKKRRTAISDILLLRAVHRLNRFIKPDVTLLLGDLVDQGHGPNSRREMLRIKEIVDLLQMPVITLPGNHEGNPDGDPEVLYEVFERPADVLDIGGVRFVPFVDPEEPNYNARRTDADLARMARARDGWEGSLVAVQHVPVFNPGASDCPYNYVNADAVLDVMRSARYTGVISGHHHEGDDLIARGAGNTVIAPALCESPFAFLVITIDGEKITAERQELRMPPELELIDYHVHTHFAYCGENMDFDMALALADEFGLARIAFTEHSDHLYFNKETYGRAGVMKDGINFTQGTVNLMPEYLEQARRRCPPAILGLEVDSDFSGRPIARAADLAQARLLIGAVHKFEEAWQPEPDPERGAHELLARLDTLLGTGIHILAHPFRVFRRSHMEVPDWVVPEVVKRLKSSGVAGEINFHTNDPTPEYVKLCLEHGVKLTLGSDAHNLREVGEFQPHLDLLRSCGVRDSDLPDALARL